MEKRISVSCECEGTGFIAVADNGGDGVEHVECGQHHPPMARNRVARQKRSPMQGHRSWSLGTFQRNGADAAELTLSRPWGPNMSLDLLTQYIDQALTFERMADAESNQSLKADLEGQARAYRRLAAQRAKRLGLPLPRSYA
jgi:hypothetical protein